MQNENEDSLTLEGLGGLYNGESFVLRAGQSATAGATSLATFPVTLCRNYRRLESEGSPFALLTRMAPEHVRFLYLGGGRLIVENLAGQDVRVGWLRIADRQEVDLKLGRAEIGFGYGERMVASISESPPRLLELGAPPDEDAAIEGVFRSLLSPGGALVRSPEEFDLTLLPDDEEEEQADPEMDTGPIPEVRMPEPGKKPRKPKRKGLFGFFRSSPAMFLSVLFHIVVVLGLFSYMTLVADRPPEAVTEVSVRAQEARFIEPEPAEAAPNDPAPSEMEAPEPASIKESESASDLLPDPAISESGEIEERFLPGSAIEGITGIGAGDIGASGGFAGHTGGGGRSGGRGRKAGAVSSGLEWLARHQDEDGSWGAISSLTGCRICNGAGKRDYRIAMTGLATLAFVGAGSTQRGGKHKKTVKLAVRFLGARQQGGGAFHRKGTAASDREMYGHAIATLAVAELYRHSRSPYLRRAVENAVRYSERGQQAYAGWRYQPGENSSDTSVTGWHVLALASAKRAGVPVNPASFAGAKAWLADMTEEKTWRVGYSQRGRGSLGMTATGIAMLLHMDAPVSDPAVRGGRKFIARNRPSAPGPGTPTMPGNPPDLYYWYFGTLALGRIGGDDNKKWNRTLIDVLLRAQERRGEAAGSFAPPGKWSRVGGRVMATALALLALEVAYGYERAFR